MRVLTFLHSFEAGGVERVAVRLVARWREMSIDAPLFMGRDDGPLRREIAVDMSYQVARQPWFGTAWWETCWMILRLPAVVRDQAPDVVFCAGSTYSIVAVALKLLLGSRCSPIVAKISNDLARSDLPRPLRMVWRAWLPAVVVEALAAGLAIVATDCGAGVSSLLEHGRLGRIVPVGRVAEFADALAAARGASLSVEAGRARAEAFTMAGSARRYVDVLRRVADRAVTADRVGESNRRERTA